MADNRAPAIHLHTEQFDGAPHPWCGRGSKAVVSDVFEVTEPALRCRLCEREWFPHGQPDWHLRAARQHVNAPPSAGEERKE